MITDQIAESNRAGGFELPGASLVDFPEGFMGMHHLNRFALVEPSGEPSPFRFLICVDEPGIGFGLADPSQLFANYEVDVSAEREVLQIESDDDVGLYVVLTIGENPMRTTANLLAPVLLNKRTGLARQLVLSDSRYSTKHPIIAAR